jgi:inositol oxygenase
MTSNSNLKYSEFLEFPEYRKYEITDNLDEASKKKIEIIHKTYKAQRNNITYEFNQYLISKYCSFQSKSAFWALFALLDNITDLSDPDTSLPNSIHALQTAEAIRASPEFSTMEWMPLVGLIHDMGKILYVQGCDNDGTSKDTQWAIVGDTFITGCKIPDTVVLSEYNTLNSDHSNDVSIYKSGCGLSNVGVAFGHDEYMYRLLKANGHKMPKEAEYIIRYHSLYAWHSSNGYDYLEDEEDRKMKKIVQKFNKFDLYSKNDNLPIKWTTDLRNYYSMLVKKYLSSNMLIKW